MDQEGGAKTEMACKGWRKKCRGKTEGVKRQKRGVPVKSTRGGARTNVNQDNPRKGREAETKDEIKK